MKRYIAYRKDENNYYDDSDFYIMLVDTVDKKVIKHIYGTTRFAGSKEFEHEYDERYGDEEISALALSYALTEAPSRIGSYDVEIGDLVKVSNPRVRKFKDETFKVDDVKEFRKFGRVVSRTLLGENVFSEPIKTAESNISVIKHGDEKLNRVANRIVVGLRIN